MEEKAIKWFELLVKMDDVPPEGRIIDAALPKEWLKEALYERQDDYWKATGEESLVYIEVLKEAGGARVKGSLTVELAFGCAWCNEPMKKRSIITIDELFLPAERFAENGKTAREIEEDLDVRLFEKGELYLHDCLSELILLSLPMTEPVETDDKGKCKKCGKTLEEIAGAQKAEKPVDHRWDKLKEIGKSGKH